MNTITLITIISFSILIIATAGDLIVNKPKNKWGVIFNYASGLAVTFIGITLGLYFTGIDNKYQEKENTIKYLNITLNDIKTIHGMVFIDYKKESAKYYGEISEEEDPETESFKDFRIPVPLTVESVIRSSVYPKHIPERLFHKLNFCYHNSHSFKRSIEAQENASEPDYEQLISDMKNYITLLSFNYYVIETELEYLNGNITNAEARERYAKGFKTTNRVLKNDIWNEFLNLKMVKDTLAIK